MIITLCGSTKFEDAFKKWNERLSLQGHVVFSLSVYPSDKEGKDWYTEEQKRTLDEIHKKKIDASDAIVVLNVNGYIGDSTVSEIVYAQTKEKKVFQIHPGVLKKGDLNLGHGFRMCPYAGCSDSTIGGPCALCYE